MSRTMQYDNTGLDILIDLIEKIDYKEHPNVRIIGDKIIVVPSPHMDRPRFYVAQFNLQGSKSKGLKPSRSWPQELLYEAGIYRPVDWIGFTCLAYFSLFPQASSTLWLAGRLGIILSPENSITLWTNELIMEYALHELTESIAFISPYLDPGSE